MKKKLKYLSCTAALILTAASALMFYASADENANVQTDIPKTTMSVQTTINSKVTVSQQVTPVSEKTTKTTVSTGITSVSITEAETTGTVTKPPINANTKKGWNKINNKWFYYNGESFVTGIKEIDGEAYLFAANGALRTGWQTVNSIRRYYDYETHSPIWEWVEYFGKKYYVDKKAGKLMGIQKINDKSYIFSKEGVLQTGFVFYGKYMYYCDENDGIYYGDNKKTPVKIGENYYFISPKGYVLRGWQTLNGQRIFYDYDTGQPVYGWIKYNGNYYYTNKLIGKHTGIKYINTHPYRFNKNGILCWGLQYFEAENGYYYFYKNGERAVNEIVYTKDGNYYFDKSGKMDTGWVNIDGKEYYFHPDGKMAIGKTQIDNDTYFFDKDGVMCIGLVVDGKNKYYFDEFGVMEYGWKTFSGKKYFFDNETGAAYVGWKDIGNAKYYFDKNAVMVTGKVNIGEDVYYFGTDGKMRTGWQVIKGKKHYFGSDGKMYTYRHVIGNLDYLFYSTGEMVTTGNQKIVLKAISQLGQEGGRPYWTWWGFNFRIEWCACFVSWCADQCGYTANNKVPTFISCKVGIDWFKAHNQWKGKNYTPKSGDYIFFDWEPDGIADHIGIVDYYENGYVYTVEGNSGDVVRKRVYEIKSENIYGFAAPNF